MGWCSRWAGQIDLRKRLRTLSTILRRNEARSNWIWLISEFDILSFWCFDHVSLSHGFSVPSRAQGAWSRKNKGQEDPDLWLWQIEKTKWTFATRLVRMQYTMVDHPHYHQIENFASNQRFKDFSRSWLWSLKQKRQRTRFGSSMNEMNEMYERYKN